MFIKGAGGGGRRLEESKNGPEVCSMTGPAESAETGSGDCLLYLQDILEAKGAKKGFNRGESPDQLDLRTRRQANVLNALTHLTGDA